MNKLKLFLIVFIGSAVLVSCGGAAKQPATADGFGELEKEIKSEFGDESYFTDLSISYDKSIGCLLYTSPSPRDKRQSRMPSSA